MAENRTEMEAGTELFRQFVFDNRLTKEEKEKITEEAILLGRKRAKEIGNEFGGKGPEEILTRMGVRIIREQGGKKINSDYVKFAEFYAKSGEIHLNEDVVRELDKKMKPGLAKDIILCHELYHCLEISRWGKTADLFVRTVKLFGWIPAKRRMLPAAEIAADSFTKAYLKLDFNPREIESYYFESGK